MLFVDDDQSQRAERGEHGRSGSHDHVHFAPTHPMPLIVTLAIGEAAMLNRDPVAERVSEGRRHRRRESDFRDQHECGPAGLVHDSREPHVDLRLAAPGHAM